MLRARNVNEDSHLVTMALYPPPRAEGEMFGSPRLSQSTLTDLCRTLRHYLGAGLMLTQAFRQQSQRGSTLVREMSTRIAGQLEQGTSLYQAMKREGELFPP